MLAELFKRMRRSADQENTRDYQDYRSCMFIVEDQEKTGFHQLLEMAFKGFGFLDDEDFPLSLAHVAIPNGQFVYFIDNLGLTPSLLPPKFTSNNLLHIWILFNGNAGEVFHGCDPGLHYSFKSHEGNQHNKPHIHVRYKGDQEVCIELAEGCEPIIGKIPDKALRKAQKRIQKNLPFLLEQWNLQTDGIRIDVDHALKTIADEGRIHHAS